jgi:hypothetical protein
MRRSFVCLAIGIALFAGCATSRPQVQLGPSAEKSPDGLHKVDHVVAGTMYMKPDYTFGSYHTYLLGKTLVTFAQDSPILDESAENDLTETFEGVVREVIRRTGRQEVSEPGPCVALVTLALVDLDLLDRKDMSRGTGSSGVDSLGSVTLVMEIRDSHTRQPLLRYGQRRRLEGTAAIGTGTGPSKALTTSFRKFADHFQSDFNRSVPPADPARPSLGCAERAGVPPLS